LDKLLEYKISCIQHVNRMLRNRLRRVMKHYPMGGAWMFVCCECCVLSGRGLCDELITRPEESYRLWCVVCELETSRIRPWPALGRSATGKKKLNTTPLPTEGIMVDLRRDFWIRETGMGPQVAQLHDRYMMMMMVMMTRKYSVGRA